MAKEKGIATEGSEMASLVDRMGGASAASPFDRFVGYSGKQYRRGQVCFLLLLVLCAGVLIVRYEEIGEWFSSHEEDVEEKPDDPDQESNRWGIPDLKLPSVSTVTDWFKGGGEDDFGGEARRSLPEMLESLSASRKRIDALIRADYGEYASVFNRNHTMSGRGISWPTELSLTRLKRRMKRKIIESQLRGGGDDDEEPVTFMWATGGHSASAAHGDLFEQSYTLTMQTAAEIAFDAVDVTFKTKHYGMGSASSPELSLCMDEIYGKDIDVLHWDFGMTDGRNYWAYYLWVDQAGLHPTFPIVFAHDDQRKGIHAECDKRGQGAFNLNGRELPRKEFPDSETHPNPSILPRGVAYFRCGGTVEQDGECKDRKFDTKWCECRGKVSWHPGWKDHLFMGRFLALFLIENLVDAVKEMHERDLSSPSKNIEETSSVSVSSPPSLSREYLEQLHAEEELDRQQFLASDTTNDIGDGSKIGAENWKRVLRSNPVCHSMRLPNQARFDGILDGVVATETSAGGYHTGIDEHYKWETLPKPGAPGLNDTFKSAITSLRPPWMMATDQEMRKPMDRYFKEGCNLTVDHDFRDGFVIRHEDDWMGDVYPTDAEIEAFSRGKYQREGFVVMCDTQCMFANCNPGGETWSLENVGNGNVSILIDDQPVAGAVNIHHNCFFLTKKGGDLKWGPGTKNGRRGQYEIKFKVPKPGKIVVSSLTVI